MTKTQTIQALRAAGFKVVSSETTKGAYKTWMKHREAYSIPVLAVAIERAFPKGTFYHDAQNHTTQEWEFRANGFSIETQCDPKWNGEPGQIYVAHYKNNATGRNLALGIDSDF